MISKKNIKEIKVDINGREINCFIEKKKQKTISIRIRENEEISIVCPFRVAYDYLEKVIMDKKEWIEKTLIKIKDAVEEKKVIEESVREKYMFLGKEYEGEFIKERRAVDYEIEDNKVLFYSKLKENKSTVKKWYKKCAEEILKKRTDYYSEIIGEKPCEVKLKTLNRSWGICSSNKNITFNWKLVMAPIDVIDYVVIHELCHLKHHNHSKDFWKEVIKYMPNFKEKKEWLRENGIKMEFIAKKII